MSGDENLEGRRSRSSNYVRGARQVKGAGGGSAERWISMRRQHSKVSIETATRKRAESVGRGRRGAVMLPATTAACRSGCLRLHNRQDKARK